MLRTTNTLKKPVLDVKAVVENVDYFREICRRRNVVSPLKESFEDQYALLKQLESQAVDTSRQRNSLQKQMAQLKKQKAPQEEISSVLAQLEMLKPKIAANTETTQHIKEDLYLQVYDLPNLIHQDVQSEQVLVEYINPTDELIALDAPKDFPLTPNEDKDHKHIMEHLDLVNFTKASSISGRGWYYLIGGAAMLEQALVQYALKLARQNGFKMITPPSIVKTEVTSACGFKPRDQNNETQVYQLPDGLCLTGTAEIPLASLYSDQELSSKKLPLNVVGVSRSYRAEAGAAGKDTRGLYRVHEFTKVELFSWTKPEQSEETFESIVRFQKSFIKSLGLTARVLIMPTDDLGNPAYKKIDIEVLMPGRGAWGEVSSTSNCLDFQSRRLTTKWNNKGKGEYVHTLNGTACAVPRVVLAIMENFYDKEMDAVKVPEVLREYMDGLEWIKE